MNSIKANMKTLGLNPGREMLLFVAGLLPLVGAGVAFMLIQQQPIFLLIPTLGGVLFGYFFFTRYSRKLKRAQVEEAEEFVRLFTYFQVFLNDGYNIYVALNSIVPFASDSVKARLEKLLSDIDVDKSITPFIDFANSFGDMQIRQVMLSIYQMVDQGTSEAYLRQFTHIFGKLSDEKHLRNKQKRIERMQTLCFLPLVGSGLSMIMLLTALVEIIGGVMNGF